jgi:hypothetical protein
MAPKIFGFHFTISSQARALRDYPDRDRAIHESAYAKDDSP